MLCCKQIVTALPPSVTDPPPKVISKSAAAERAELAHWTTASRGEWAGMLSCKPQNLSPKASFILSTSSVSLFSVPPTNKNTLDAPMRSISSMTALAAGCPKRTLSISPNLITPDCICKASQLLYWDIFLLSMITPATLWLFPII